MNDALSDLNSRNGMNWIRLFVVVSFVFLLGTGSAVSDSHVCDGKYKDGGRPDQAELGRVNTIWPTVWLMLILSVRSDLG